MSMFTKHTTASVVCDHPQRQFQCPNGWCLFYESRCNGVRGCTDGSDEENCGKLYFDIDTFYLIANKLNVTFTIFQLTILSLEVLDSKCRQRGHLCKIMSFINTILVVLNEDIHTKIEWKYTLYVKSLLKFRLNYVLF